MNCLIAVGGLIIDWALGQRDVVQRVCGLTFSDVLDGKIWELFTHMWVHAGLYDFNVAHLLFNMFALWMFGRVVENELGPRHFTFIYFFGGLCSALFAGLEAWIRVTTNLGYEQRPLVGASGAVFALVSVFACMNPNAKLIVFPIPFPVKARNALIGFVIVSIVFAVTNTLGFVAHTAHVGGILWGYLYARSLGFAAPRVPWSRRWRNRGVKEEVQTVEVDVAFFERMEVDAMSDEELNQELDRILSKISSQGMQSLTEKDRRILTRAREKL